MIQEKYQVDETPRSPLGVQALSIYTDFIIEYRTKSSQLVFLRAETASGDE